MPICQLCSNAKVEWTYKAPRPNIHNSHILCRPPIFNRPIAGMGSAQIAQSSTIPNIAVDQK